MRPVATANTEAQIIDKLVELTRERGDSANKTLNGDIGYSRGAGERAAKLKAALTSKLRFDRLDTTEISAAVLIHNGTGFLDYAFFPNPD